MQHGVARWAAVEDAGRLRDALGVALPAGVPFAFTEPVTDPLGDLVVRYARTHTPFTADALATWLGIGRAVALDALRRLQQTGRVVEGEFTPGASGREFVDPGVLRLIRRRSVAALRAEVEPVPPEDFAAFLPAWQGVGASAGPAGGGAGAYRGVDGVLRAVEQLAGVVLPASAVEALVLPARIRDYTPAMLDELCAAGEVVWRGHGSLAANDGWVSLWPADLAHLAGPATADPDGADELAVLSALHAGGALFFAQLTSALAQAAGTSATTAARDASAALWSLVWKGHLTNDTLAPLRARLGGGSTTHRARAAAPPSRYGRPRLPRTPRLDAPRDVGGRWSAFPAVEVDPTEALVTRAELLLDRYGVVTRGSVQAEGIEGGFAGVYKVLSAAEDAGRVRRGYFVEGLGAAQFATTGAIDRLRGTSRPSTGSGTGLSTGSGTGALVLAASDPANPFGAALPWPSSGDHKPGRKAGALVVLDDGHLVAWLERGGRTALTWRPDPDTVARAAEALAGLVRGGRLASLTVEKVDGVAALGADHPFVHALLVAGFHQTPKGIRLRR